MRRLFGVGTPRSLQNRAAAFCAALRRLFIGLRELLRRLYAFPPRRTPRATTTTPLLVAA